MTTPPSQPADFTEITQLIASARARAMQAVSTSLIDLYWQVGQFISQRIANAQWGDGVVAALAVHLAQTQPNLRGFTRPNLFRMRQFYQAYQHNVKVSPLSRQLPWSVGAVAIFPTCINLVACQKPGLRLCKNVVSKTVEV